MKTKAELESEISAIKAMLSTDTLKPVPGLYHAAHTGPDGKVTPAYMLPSRNTMGIPFVMPDFVRHDGLVKGEGFQDFSHDVHHLVGRNVEENLGAGLIKKCWSEMHRVGTPEKRWREGRLGNAGILEGKTVVVCAPGPSLADELVTIANLRRENKVVVMAINRAVRALAADYLVYIERDIPEGWRDDYVLGLQKDAKVILAPQSDYRLAAAWPNKDNLYWGFFNFGHVAGDPRINWLATMDAMASTTLATAVRVAYELGAERILLAGVDFACKADPIIVRMPLSMDRAEEGMAILSALAEDVSAGNGKKEEVKELAARVVGFTRDRETYGWAKVWRPGNFYFDQPFEQTQYRGDPRFSNWSPVKSVGGHPVLTTLELLSYAEQLRTVIGVIESGSDCRIANVSPYSALQWRYIPLMQAVSEK